MASKTAHPLYGVWGSIKTRCLNPRAKCWQHYGGRGITICDRWRSSFAAFVSDIGERPTPKHQLDRIDNARGYEPGNTRWVTAREQSLNRRSNIYLTLNGETLTVVEWSARLGRSSFSLYGRVRRGMSDADVLTRPSRYRREAWARGAEYCLEAEDDQ